MKRTIPLLFILTVLLPAPVLAHDLADVYHQALQNDAQLQAAAAQRKAELEAKPQARALLLPTLSGQASYSWNHHRILSGSSIGHATSNYTEPQAVLNLTQPLFDWNAWSKLEQADQTVAKAEAQFRLAKQSLITRVSSAYFNVLQAKDNLRFALANKSAIAHQLEQAKQRYEVGTAANTDLQNARASFDQAKAAVIQAKSTLHDARHSLSVITGIPTTSVAPLRKEIPLNPPDPSSPQAWVHIATNSNLKIKSAEIQSKIKQKQIDIENAGHYPTLDLVGNYGYDNARDMRVNGTESVSGAVGLQLNIPIFTGGAVSSQVSQARALYQKSLFDLEQSRRQVRANTRNDYDQVLLGVSQVKALRQGVKSAQVSLQATKEGFKVGTRTQLDVLNAQQSLFQAQQKSAQSQYTYLNSLLQLKKDAGSLGPGDIMAINELTVTQSGDNGANKKDSTN